MKSIFAFAALILLAVSLSAGDAPPTNQDKGPGGGPGRSGHGSDEWMKRVVAENPELQGVDLTTPDGKDKLHAVMQKRMAIRMRQNIAQDQAELHADLKKSFAMNDDEFKAIEPLLIRVENLREQQHYFDRSGSGRISHGPSDRYSYSDVNLQVLLGDGSLEPSIQASMDANKALKALISDPQANAAEMDAALARLRQARVDFRAALSKAEADLQAVLNHRQEAILVDRGILE